MNARFTVANFANKWTELYRLLDDVFNYFHSAYRESEKTICYPPHLNPPLSATLHTLDLHPLIVELLPLLPYPQDQETESATCILPCTRPLCYLDTRGDPLKWSRNPTQYYFSDIGKATALPREEIALTTAAEFGIVLILNVEQGTIREVMWHELDPDTPAPYSANSIVKNAMEAVEEYITKIKTLEWIPIESDLTDDGIVDSASPTVREHLKSVLTEIYGYPSEFQLDMWKEKRSIHYKEGLRLSIEAADRKAAVDARILHDEVMRAEGSIFDRCTIL